MKDQHKLSPVVRADTKLCGSPPHVFVDVRFGSKEEIDRLIDALTQLRDTGEGDFDHVHLQDRNLRPGAKCPLSAMEVNFYRPGKKREGADYKAMLDGAELSKRSIRKREG